MHKYVSLTHTDHSPCVLRVDKIKGMKMMPGNHTEIEYADGRTFLVRESGLEIDNLVEAAKYVFKADEIKRMKQTDENRTD